MVSHSMDKEAETQRLVGLPKVKQLTSRETPI